MKKQTFTLLLCCIALTTQASIQRTVSLEGAHFGTGSDVTIEATNIEITEVLKLSSGSKLTVIAHGLAHLEDITVPAGATLIINADSLDIEKGTFYFSPGCTVIINGEDWSDRFQSRRRKVSAFEDMTVEGRTWWYEIPAISDSDPSEHSESG